MNPVSFKQANGVFGPPPELTKEQVCPIPVFVGQVMGGSCDGCTAVVVAWEPDEADLTALNQRGLIYLSCLGSLPAHTLTTSFESAVHPK